MNRMNYKPDRIPGPSARTILVSALILSMLTICLGAQSANMIVVSTPDLITGNLTIPVSVTVYQPLPVAFNITNMGQHSIIGINVSVGIDGPKDYAYSFYAGSLTPEQSSSISVYLSNATEYPGFYTVYVNASYIVNGTRYRSGVGGQYTVVTSQYASKPKAFESSISGVNITYLPLEYYVMPGSVQLLQLGFRNNAGNTIEVNLSTNSRFGTIVNFSTGLMYLKSNETQVPNLLFNPSNSLSGTYTVPVTVAVSEPNRRKAQSTEYINLYQIANITGHASIYNNVYLYDNATAASGMLQMYGPTGIQLNSTTVQLMLPLGVSANQSYISPYGAQSSVSSYNGFYSISWNGINLPMDQAKFVYYTIAPVQNISALLNPQIVFISSSPLLGKNIFRLTNSDMPRFYANSTANVSIEGFYSGTSSGPMYLSLTGPQGIGISNSVYSVNVTPNEAIYKSFVVTGLVTTGTYVLNLHMSAEGAMENYSIPIVILPNSKGTISGALKTQIPLYLYLLLTIAIIVVATMLYLNKRDKSRQKYRPDMARKLLSIKQQMERPNEKE